MTGPMTGDRALVDKAIDGLLAAHDPAHDDLTTFLGAQFDAGLAWVNAEPGLGGLGVAASQQSRVAARLHDAGCPPVDGERFVGVFQSAAALHAAGTAEQKARLLRPLFTGEELWCQLFSEPGAGSDLAGLSTSAVRDGDEWIVNGQKVWTSGARTARWAILLARTDPHVPKHRGLTFFVCDMHADGVDIRPLRQADGGAHFNEVFLTDVRVPDSMRVGDVGQGWGVSLAGLNSEREGFALGVQIGLTFDEVLELWRGREQRSDAETAVLRERVVQAWITERILDYSNLRMKAAQGKGGADNHGSLAKINRARHGQQLQDLAADILGADAMLGGDYAWAVEGRAPSVALHLVRSRAMTIEGGTSEIMLNVTAERVLGLPGDVRVDKDRPWIEVPR
jgi:alkylation response protein AidB-like acyl-CoA dehydrogenase